ncbi:MAG: SpoIID/LytB domain-containing protein [Clostridiaceae bacterium]|nr:SpoIID/LytB domain-containing protein [Clostridiaceae bacterium]
MDMRLFLLKKEGEEIPLKARIKVVSNLNSFSDEDVNFEEFTSLKALFAELSGALKKNDFIVIAVSSPIYNKTKLKLMSALSLKATANALVEQRITSLDLDEEAAHRNVLFPEDAVVFPTDDGVNSGFAVKKGKQSIVVLPIDERYTDEVVKKGLVPYITSGYVTPMPQEEEKPQQQEAPVEEVPASAITDNEKQIALRTLNLLKESGTVIAVNANANAEVLKQFGEGFDGFDEHFVFTPHIEDRGDYNVTDYTAQMARSAKGLSKADFGACISDIFTAEEVDYICIAVATDKSALVRKLYKEEDETDEQFVNGAAEELFALIAEKTSGNSSVGIEIPQEEAPDRKGLKKSTKIIIAVACVLLAAALAVGAMFFIKYKNGKEPETTTEPTTETTTAAPETTTEPPVVIDAMPLSELIRYELENGIMNDAKKAPETTTEATTAGAITEDDTTTTEAAEQPVYAPKTITVNGVEMEAKAAIASIVAAEMDSSYTDNAIKAQAVVAYTYLKYRNTDWVIDNIVIDDAYPQETYDLVNEVFGEYLRFGEEVAFTPFHRMSAGKTASSDLIFGKHFDYLQGALSTSDKKRDGFKAEVEVTAEELMNAVKAYDPTITLGEDAATWLEIIAHDGAMNGTAGYVEKIKVGEKEVSGMTFVYDILASKKLASPAFSVKYNPDSQSFTITTYGQGYGVGMSQLGADRLALNGKKYNGILDQYYPGTILEKENTAE